MAKMLAYTNMSREVIKRIIIMTRNMVKMGYKQIPKRTTIGINTLKHR